MKGRLTSSESEGAFPSANSLSNRYNHGGWSKSKPGAQNSICSPMWVDGPKYLSHPQLLSQQHQQAAGYEVEGWDLNWHFNLECWHHECRINPMCHNNSPIIYHHHHSSFCFCVSNLLKKITFLLSEQYPLMFFLLWIY